MSFTTVFRQVIKANSHPNVSLFFCSEKSTLVSEWIRDDGSPGRTGPVSVPLLLHGHRENTKTAADEGWSAGLLALDARDPRVIERNTEKTLENDDKKAMLAYIQRNNLQESK